MQDGERSPSSGTASRSCATDLDRAGGHPPGIRPAPDDGPTAATRGGALVARPRGVADRKRGCSAGEKAGQTGGPGAVGPGRRRRRRGRGRAGAAASGRGPPPALLSAHPRRGPSVPAAGGPRGPRLRARAAARGSADEGIRATTGSAEGGVGGTAIRARGGASNGAAWGADAPTVAKFEAGAGPPAPSGHRESSPATCARKAARRWGGMASRPASWANLASSRRRQSDAAEAAAAGPDIWARRRLPRNRGDHGAAPATSQRTLARAGAARPERNDGTAEGRSVTAAVAPKRSTSTTAPAGTPTASATSVRRRCERASRETPDT